MGPWFPFSRMISFRSRHVRIRRSLPHNGECIRNRSMYSRRKDTASQTTKYHVNKPTDLDPAHLATSVCWLEALACYRIRGRLWWLRIPVPGGFPTKSMSAPCHNRNTAGPYLPDRLSHISLVLVKLGEPYQRLGLYKAEIRDNALERYR